MRTDLKHSTHFTALNLLLLFLFAALLPVGLFLYFSLAKQGLVFPIRKLETALKIFPNLREIVPALSQLESPIAASRFALLYANIFLWNVAVFMPIAIFVVLKTHSRFIFDRKRQLNFKLWRAALIMFVFFLGCVYLQFFFVWTYSPPRWVSTERVVSSQTSASWVNLVLLNISTLPLMRILVLIFWK